MNGRVSGATGKSMQPTPQRSPIGAIEAGVRELARAYYQATAHEFRAVGLALDGAMFERVRLEAIDRGRVLDAKTDLFEIDVDGTRVQLVRKEAR